MSDDATLHATVTAASGAGATLTLPAPAPGLIFLTSLDIELYATAARAGSATPLVVTSTNLPGSPAWIFETAQAVGTVIRRLKEYSNPLRASALSTAVTIVAPVATAGIWRLSAMYFIR